MLNKNWLFITLLLIAISLIVKQPALLLIAFLFFLTSGAARIWSRYSLKRLEFKRKLSMERVFFGESITLDLTLSNTKLLPLPWIDIEEEVPEGVTFLKGKISGGFKPDRPILSVFCSLSWYYRLTRRYPIQCLKRGVFYFGPSSIISGDPFGFFRNSITDEQVDKLMVYPPIIPIEELGIPSRHPFGDLRIKRHLFEDHVQTATTRDYVRGDPVKNIHWKTSARIQRLQSRVFEHTTTMDMALFLDMMTVTRKNFRFDIKTDLLETAIITATAIASHSLNNGYKVGLFINELQENIIPRIPPSEHPDQMKKILEAMARIRGNPDAIIDIENIIRHEARQLSWETAIVLVASVLRDETIYILKQLRGAGRRVSLVLIGKRARLIRMDGVTVYRVSEEVYARHLESLRMEAVV